VSEAVVCEDRSVLSAVACIPIGKEVVSEYLVQVVLVCWMAALPVFGRPFEWPRSTLVCAGEVGPFILAWLPGFTRSFMMKKLSMRGSLLLGVLLAVCAFVPAMASAASFSPVGTTHQLASSGLAFTIESAPIGGPTGFVCGLWTLDANVTSTSDVSISAARFDRCHGLLAYANCTLTLVPTSLPWTATAPNTTNIQIHNINIDITYETTPGNPNSCPPVTQANGAKVLLTGTLTGGSWDPVGNRLTLRAETGLAAHFLGPFGLTSGTTVTGDVTDPANTLRIFD
jgi:hypothetical protein